jgi:hypothetical protein
MRTGENAMSIGRRTRADIDREKLLADLAARPQPSEEEIERWVAEDGGALTDKELAEAVPVYPPPKPEDVRALRGAAGAEPDAVRAYVRFQCRHRAAI